MGHRPARSRRCVLACCLRFRLHVAIISRFMRRHFVSSRTRIEWAKEDAAHFERSARRFFKSAKGAVVVEPDVDGIYEVHKFRLKKPLPDVLTKKTVSSVERRSTLRYMRLAGSL